MAVSAANAWELTTLYRPVDICEERSATITTRDSILCQYGRSPERENEQIILKSCGSEMEAMQFV